MEIKEKTFVVVIPLKMVGIVREATSENGPFRVETPDRQEWFEKKQLFPIVEEGQETPNIWRDNEYQIIVNLAIMIHDQQEQINGLRSDLDSMVEALKKTQERLREHGAIRN